MTKEQVLEIIERIKNNETFTEIAKIFNVNPSTISDINNGDTWHFENLKYPIINKNNKRYFTEEEIQDIYSKLRMGIASRKIGEEYNVSKVTICNINNGLIYKHINETYPIYKAVNSVKRLEANKIKEIII